MVTVVRVVFCSGSVGKVRLVGAVLVLVECGKVGQVVGMLASSSQDDISNTGCNGDCILRYECRK